MCLLHSRALCAQQEGGRDACALAVVGERLRQGCSQRRDLVSPHWEQRPFESPLRALFSPVVPAHRDHLDGR